MKANEAPDESPLTGIKVIELGNFITAPFASRLLAEFGAHVIKVEPPGVGDPLRNWRTMHTAPRCGGTYNHAIRSRSRSI
jgi:formyl-CoA transferase